MDGGAKGALSATVDRFCAGSLGGLWIASVTGVGCSQAVSADLALPALLGVGSTTIEFRSNSGNAPRGDLPELIEFKYNHRTAIVTAD